MNGLSTHVLDQVHGGPAKGVVIKVYRDDSIVRQATTDEDGRCDNLHGEGSMPAGRYRLVFAIGDYFLSNKVIQSPAFFDVVSIDFTIEREGEKYHVPLLASPYGYSTYRGS